MGEERETRLSTSDNSASCSGCNVIPRGNSFMSTESSCFFLLTGCRYSDCKADNFTEMIRRQTFFCDRKHKSGSRRGLALKCQERWTVAGRRRGNVSQSRSLPSATTSKKFCPSHGWLFYWYYDEARSAITTHLVWFQNETCDKKDLIFVNIEISLSNSAFIFSTRITTSVSQWQKHAL